MELLRKSLVTAFILVDRNIMTEALAEQLVFKTLLHSGVHSLDQLSTAQLISRIELCLPLLQREHYNLLSEYRYEMKTKGNELVERRSPTILVISEIRNRLEFRPTSISVDQFMHLLSLKKPQHIKTTNWKYRSFRLIRHYAPSSLRYIEDQIIKSVQPGQQKAELLV